MPGNSTRGAISSDGERIFWEAKQNLYLRDMARGETLQLDQAEGCAGCTSGGGHFQIASADGSRVLFTDENKLTEGSGAGVGKRDLYECQIVASGEGEESCKLSDLTPKHGAEGADVRGGVLGASEDGAAVYFVANGVLSEAANARGEKAKPRQPNLYVHRGGASEFIATLAGEDEHDWDRKAPGPADARLAQRPLPGVDVPSAADGL